MFRRKHRYSKQQGSLLKEQKPASFATDFEQLWAKHSVGIIKAR